MRGMVITGLGLVGGFGCGKGDLLAALEHRKPHIVQVPLRDHHLPLFQADTSPLEQYLGTRALRRIDRFSRLALLGAFQALEDAGQTSLDRSRIGLVIGTGFGALSTTFSFLDSVIDDGDACASPTAFSNSVHNAAAAHISIQLQLTGPSLTLSQFDQSLVAALTSAGQWLDEGRVDAVLLGVVDEYCPVLGYCWERFLGNRDNAVPTPLNFARNTAIAGEGAAFFLLQPVSGAADGYGCIEALQAGSNRDGGPSLPPGQPLILSCIGLRDSGIHYRQQLEVTRPVACYTPLYGGSPVTQAFDLAVGALSLSRGSLFASADSGDDYYPGLVVANRQPCRALCCLHYGPTGDYGAVHMSLGKS